MKRPNNGIACLKCGASNSRVALTKSSNDGVTVRRRACRDCDFRWYTCQEPEYVVRRGRDFKFYGRGRGERVIFLNQEVGG